MNTSINETPNSGSLQSTSDSSLISEECGPAELFPNCHNFHFVKKLSDAKFPVYLVCYPQTNQCYAMKVFPWEDNAPSSFFIKEIRFSRFVHQNIIPIVYYQYEDESSSSGHSTKVSYILMDYAKYGDFFDVLISNKISFNDILVRTYFHQLISGLEALHSTGSAHLDIKLENLLMSEDFTLKLTDFDLSYMPEDGPVKTRGTKNFRAPEMCKGTCTNPQAADIYSAGIILFLLKTGGLVPYREDDNEKGEMEGFSQANSKRFWERQCEILDVKPGFFSEDFKSLFNWMTRTRPEERFTIADIKKSRWYNREIYSEEELESHMTDLFDCEWS